MRLKIIRTATVPISLDVLLKGQLKFLSNTYDVVGLGSSGLALGKMGNREGIRVIAVNMERGISPFKDLISLYRMYIQFKKEKPQIVHSITPKAGLLTMLAGKMAGVPIRMHTFTGLIFPSRQGMIQQLLIKMDQLLCWAATNIYPEGNGVKNDLINYKITAKPLEVLANGNVNGVDLECFSIDKLEGEVSSLKCDLAIVEADFVFIFVGRLVGDKGINELIEAFSHVAKEKNNIKLLLVGGLEPELDPLAVHTMQEIESNPQIISVGFQSDVRPYFAISDALVFPSYREGFPNVVIQAGAMGLPSIVTNINGCNEIIIEGENGLIVPVKDVGAIYRSLLKLYEDNDYFQYLKNNARRMITERYEQKLVWNALLAEYNRLLVDKGFTVQQK